MTHQPDQQHEATVAPEAHEIREEQVSVEVERSVRFGRILLVFAGIGGIIAVMLTLLNPVEEGALYEMRQIAGFMLLIGAALGLAAGAVLSLILHLVAKRKRGTGVALHTDVQ